MNKPKMLHVMDCEKSLNGSQSATNGAARIFLPPNAVA